MNDNELASRIETLEIRLMHQEASIEALTLSLIHISEPTRLLRRSRIPSSA